MSLCQFLLSTIKSKIHLDDPSLEKYIVCCKLSHFSIEKVIAFEENQGEEGKNKIEAITNSYLKCNLFNPESDEENLTTEIQRKIYQETLDVLIKIQYPIYLDELLSKFLDKSYYLKNFDYVNEIEEETIIAIKKDNEDYL